MTYLEKISKTELKDSPIIMGIETSCDETAVAIIKNGREIIADEIISSATEHAKFGGVVPEIASRSHTTAILTATKRALTSANLTLKDIDAFAVTKGAGLLGALLVGVSFAKSLAYSLGKPLVPVSHIRGHIAASYLADKNLEPPFITILASGGHTAIIAVENYYKIKVLGSTLDDAVGEAFDKVARVLGLNYPGGPNVEKLAKEGKIKLSKDELLEPKISDDNYYYKDLPKSWVCCTLGSISSIISKGTTPRNKNSYCNNGVGFLRIENINDNFTISKKDMKYITQEVNDFELKRSILQDEDIIISIAGTLGKMAIIKKSTSNRC